MPKADIDYSTTVIYKITCKDPNIKDLYVGHTTNFVQRKQSHKQSCTNEKSSNYKCKLYEMIRKTGGWDNWTMEIINFFKCENQYEARTKEQEYFVLLNATLNSIEPLPKPKPKEVVPENIVVESNEPDNTNPRSGKYMCEKCNFICSKKSDWERHISTTKHNMNHSNVVTTKTPNTEFLCKKCNKSYTARNSLWYHEQKCNYTKDDPFTEDANVGQADSNDLYGIIKLLIKENQEIRNLVITQHNTIVDQNKTLTEVVKNQQIIINNIHDKS